MSRETTVSENPGGPVSAYVAKWTPRPRSKQGLCALDIPCGRGRHSFYLASLGYEVVAIDIDPELIAQLASEIAQQPGLRVRTFLGDADAPLPVEDHTFDLVVTTHFVSPALFDQVPTVLKPGGLLIYETFGAQGGNWRSLPRPGAVREHLAGCFEILDYRERPVGPVGSAAVVVRTVAQLR
jgi:SAM-dependent methyltransferase